MQSQPNAWHGADSQRMRTPVPDGTSQARPPVGYVQPMAQAPWSQAPSYGGEADFVRGMQAAQGMPVQPSGAWVPAEQSVPYPPVDRPVPQGIPLQPSGAYGPPQGPYPPVEMNPQPSGAYAPQNSGAWQAAPEPEWRTGYTAPIDPFDEPGVDPKLKRQRSSKLYSRKDPFWDAPDAPHGTDKLRSHAGSHAGRRAMLSLMVLVVVGVVLYGVVFRVRTIHVEGNQQISDEEVIALSGIEQGASIARVDTAQAEKGINAHRYLIFEDVERELPGTVTIRVKERTAAAVMNYCGINYTIDAKGVVLEESENMADTGGLAQVSGMDVAGQNGCVLGRTISVNNMAQLLTLREILAELQLLSAQGDVTKIKLSDMSHILLETSEGYSVSLGDSTNLHAKLKAMLSIKATLNTMETGLGTLDVSTPTAPVFLPEAS